MEKEYKMGVTGHSDFGVVTGRSDCGEGAGWTGAPGPSYNPADQRIDEMIRLLRSIDENVKQINAKLK